MFVLTSCNEEKNLLICSLRYKGEREAHDFTLFSRIAYPLLSSILSSSTHLCPAIIWMDNLYCKGNEHELHHCPFDGWKIHDCEANEVAGVVCKESIIQPSSAAADRVPAHPAPLPPTTTTSTAAVIPSLHRRHRLQLERGEDSDANQVINLQGNLLQPDLQLGQHHETTLPHAEPLLLPPDPSPSSPSPPSSRSAFHRLPLLSNPPPSTTISPSTTTTIASSSSASSSNQSQDVIRPTHNRSRQRQANHVPRLSQPLLQAASQYQVMLRNRMKSHAITNNLLSLMFILIVSTSDRAIIARMDTMPSV